MKRLPTPVPRCLGCGATLNVRERVHPKCLNGLNHVCVHDSEKERSLALHVFREVDSRELRGLRREIAS